MKRALLPTLALLALALSGLFALSLPSGVVNADCEWSYTWDAATLEGFGVIDTGSFESGVGLHSADAGGSQDLILYAWELSPHVTITRITADIVLEGTAAFDNFIESDVDHQWFENAAEYTDTTVIDTGALSWPDVGGLQIVYSSETVPFTVTAITYYGEGVNGLGVGEGCGATDTPTPDGSSLVITVVLVYPTATEGPSPTPTPDYHIHYTLPVGDSSYDVSVNTEVRPAEALIIGLLAILVGFAMFALLRDMLRGGK